MNTKIILAVVLAIIVLQPYPGDSSLRSGAGGVPPRLWSFAPKALI